MRSYYITQIFKQGVREVNSLSDSKIQACVQEYICRAIEEQVLEKDHVLSKVITGFVIEIVHSIKKLKKISRYNT